jgi:hypothetical protein
VANQSIGCFGNTSTERFVRAQNHLEATVSVTLAFMAKHRQEVSPFSTYKTEKFRCIARFE